MAGHESDREDLMREAVALVRRIELRIPGEIETVICGFRRDGALSCYFGPDPVYHFDSELRLRRAFAGGLLYRTQGTTLARLKRERRKEATELLRHDLTENELAEFLQSMQVRLERLLAAFDSETAVTVAQVPADDPIAPDLVTALRSILQAPHRLAPAIKGKR